MDIRVLFWLLFTHLSNWGIFLPMLFYWSEFFSSYLCDQSVTIICNRPLFADYKVLITLYEFYIPQIPCARKRLNRSVSVPRASLSNASFEAPSAIHISPYSLYNIHPRFIYIGQLIWSFVMGIEVRCVFLLYFNDYGNIYYPTASRTTSFHSVECCRKWMALLLRSSTIVLYSLLTDHESRWYSSSESKRATLVRW